MDSLTYKKKYNVLMVDDEYIILKGLEKMIDWDELNLNLVATASHGEEALEVIEQNTIDIIITDVNMPRINGIEFIERLKSNNKKIEFLFISGYEKFEYIKSGLVLGANDYILKPIDKNELHRALQKIINKLDQHADQGYPKVNDAQIKLAEWLNETNSPKLISPINQKDFNLFLMTNNKEDSIESLWKYYHDNNDWMVIGKNDRVIAMINLSDSYELKGKIIGNLENLTAEQLHRGYHKIRQKFRNFNFYMHDGQDTDLKQYFLVNLENSLLHQSSLSNTIGLIYHALENNKWREVLNLLDKIKEDLSDLAMNRGEVIQIMQSFLHYHVNEEVLLEERMTIDELIDETARLLGVTSSQIKFEQLHPSIQQALDIIEKDYQKDLSLSQLADILHLNVMYLGQLFKKELGQSFSQYLNQWRIDLAKQLLQKTQLTVSEVGNEVGYQNQAYFYRMFKKYEGLSPKEYRQKLSDDLIN